MVPVKPQLPSFSGKQTSKSPAKILHVSRQEIEREHQTQQPALFSFVHTCSHVHVHPYVYTTFPWVVKSPNKFVLQKLIEVLLFCSPVPAVLPPGEGHSDCSVSRASQTVS